MKFWENSKFISNNFLPMSFFNASERVSAYVKTTIIFYGMQTMVFSKMNTVPHGSEYNNLTILNCLHSEEITLPNSMAYRTRRFNVAFTRALQ